MFHHMWRRPAARTGLPSRDRNLLCSRSRPRLRLGLEPLEDRCVPAVDVILEWNAVMIQADAVAHSGGVNDQPGPILAQRAFAIASAAMYDAYNSIERIGQRYLVTAPNSSNADSDAAVAQAAHDTLVALYPSQRVAFDAALTQTLRRIPDGSRENRGRAVGAFVADFILDARANDGGNTFDDIQNPPYVPNGQPGFHDVDPTNPGQGFYGPDAGNVDSVRHPQHRAVRPGHLGAQGVGSATTNIAAFLRTQDYERGLRRGQAPRRRRRDDADRSAPPSRPRSASTGATTAGRGWARRRGCTTRSPAPWPSRRATPRRRTPGMFALVNIAMADAGLTAWEAKYDEEFWRPILGIRRGGEDGNPDTRGDVNWTPLGAPASNPFPGQINFTPPFPAYTSGHATFGAAAVPDAGAVLRHQQHHLHLRLRRVQRHHPRRDGPACRVPSWRAPSPASIRRRRRTARAASTSASTGPSTRPRASAPATRSPTSSSTTSSGRIRAPATARRRPT